MPPPAEGLASRIFLGPALRTQPDRRLVALVRDGYETAFEEIVRRYGKPLTRYAASIVGGRSEDVIQDAFAKALPALRRDDAEIDLRAWLFRIVRNTALNDLRDRPPSPEVLAETISGGGDPAEELERREELADLMRRLEALPESQRAAIVMRELEGLSHEEIAVALGLSGGAARQAIYRARRALRDGIGMLVPLPLLQSMLAVAASPGANETAAGVAGIGGAAGAGMALKATAATVLVAGAVGAGVAVERGHRVDSAEAGPPVTRDSGEAREAGPGRSEPGRTDASGGDRRSGDDRGASGRDRDEGDERASHVAGSDGPGRSGAPGGRSSGPSGGGHGSGEDGDRDRGGALPDDRSGHDGPGSGDDDRQRHGGEDDGLEPEDDSHSGPGSGAEEPEHASGSGDGADEPEEHVEDSAGSGEDGGGEGGSGSTSDSGSHLDGYTGSGDSHDASGLVQ